MFVCIHIQAKSWFLWRKTIALFTRQLFNKGNHSFINTSITLANKWKKYYQHHVFEAILLSSNGIQIHRKPCSHTNLQMYEKISSSNDMQTHKKMCPYNNMQIYKKSHSFKDIQIQETYYFYLCSNIYNYIKTTIVMLYISRVSSSVWIQKLLYQPRKQSLWKK